MLRAHQPTKLVRSENWFSGKPHIKGEIRNEGQKDARVRITSEEGTTQKIN